MKSQNENKMTKGLYGNCPQKPSECSTDYPTNVPVEELEAKKLGLESCTWNSPLDLILALFRKNSS